MEGKWSDTQRAVGALIEKFTVTVFQLQLPWRIEHDQATKSVGEVNGLADSGQH